GYFHQNDVVQTHTVERVLERDATLYLVRLDHGGEHVAHGERFASGGDGLPGQPVGSGQDAAQVVRRVAPFGRQPGVVEVQPANHGADVERGLYGVELVGRTRYLRAMGNDGARHDGAE